MEAFVTGLGLTLVGILLYHWLNFLALSTLPIAMKLQIIRQLRHDQRKELTKAEQEGML